MVLITLIKSDCKCKINVRDQTYTKIWFVTSKDLSVISSELLSLPQTISLYNKIELSETCHYIRSSWPYMPLLLFPMEGLYVL